MSQRVMKIGNSLGVTVPADFVKAIGISPGDKVEVKKKFSRNQLVYKFSGIQQLLISTDLLNLKRKKQK